MAEEAAFLAGGITIIVILLAAGIVFGLGVGIGKFGRRDKNK